MLAQEGGIEEGVRRTRVDQRLNGDRRLTGDEDMNQQGKVTRNGVGEGNRKRKGASQPGPYWLGWPFFGREVSKGVGGEGVRGGGGTGVQEPGNMSVHNSSCAYIVQVRVE